MAGDGDAPSDRLRERAAQSRVKLWVLQQAPRWLVTAVLVAVVLLSLIGLSRLHPAPASVIRSGDPVQTLFQALLAATITGVTLVLTLNQVVLSQELGAAGDQRDRMDGAIAFRRDVAEVIEAPVSPARPAQFLRALVEVAARRVEDLRQAIPDADPDLRSAVDDLADSLTGNARRVSEGLDDAQFGDFDVVSAALNFNYSWKIFAARRIRERHGDALTDEARDALDGLIETLELFGPAREHVKTLYFQWELTNLSSRILAASIPALVVSIGMVVFFDPAASAGTILGVSTLVVAVAAAATVAVVPFLMLLAYVMRIATVTKHTLSIGPFILRETEEVAEVEWDR